MSKQHIILSAEDTTPIVQIPREFREIGVEAVEALWRVAHAIVQDEVGKVKHACEQRENLVAQRYQESLHTIEGLNKDVAALKLQADNWSRENKALEAALEDKGVELQVVQEKSSHANEKLNYLDQEMRRQLEELGRAKEIADNAQRRFEELSREHKKQQESLRELREESVVGNRTRERLETNLENLHEELTQKRDQLRIEQSNAAAARAALDEAHNLIKRQEMEIKDLKAEAHEQRESIASEIKARSEGDKKIALLMAQLENQERSYRDNMQKMEQELSANKSEMLSLRNRMIKTEGALERETKARERLESKLLTGSGSKY